MAIRLIKNNRGIELIITILLMTVILFLAAYLLDAALIENRIALSQSWGAKTYYLAEAGIQEMVWKLKNDSAYKLNFETNRPVWLGQWFIRGNYHQLRPSAWHDCFHRRHRIGRRYNQPKNSKNRGF